MTESDMLVNEPVEQPPTSEALVYQEMKDGRPVISSAEFQRLYHTDIRALGAEHAVTFDFEGFVRYEGENAPEGLRYKDVMATNGLQKAETYDGIHIGIDGVSDSSEALVTEGMISPSEVNGYVAYITIPMALQKAGACFCRYGTCHPLSKWEDGIDGDLEEYYQNTQPSLVSMPLPVYPTQDPHAREKVEVMNAALIRYIEKGEPLYDIENMVHNFGEELERITMEDLEKRVAELRA